MCTGDVGHSTANTAPRWCTRDSLSSAALDIFLPPKSTGPAGRRSKRDRDRDRDRRERKKKSKKEKKEKKAKEPKLYQMVGCSPFLDT